MFKKLKHM